MSITKTENISPKNNKRKAGMKTLRLYAVALAVVFVICGLCALFQMTNSKTVTVTVNSASVAAGQNPDGTPFDIYQIFSDEVLEMASEKLGGRISAAELKRHLSVSDGMTVKANQQLKQSILDGENENTYFPTVYQITYETVSDEMKSEGFGKQVGAFFRGITGPRMDKILDAVAQSYQQYYESSYLTYAAMYEIDWESIDAMDYYNRAEALRVESMRILRFLQDKSNESLAATPDSNLTYVDLANDLWRLINGDIENHKAYIIQNSIATSSRELLRQFRYMEELHIEEKERRTEEYLILDKAVDMYDSTTTKVVFIPALDQDDSFYMNRTKVGLDYLVEQADAARLAADEAEHNAQYYQYLQDCFAEASSPKQAQIDHADAIYLSIKTQVMELSESVKLLMAENNRNQNEGIKAGKAAMTVSIVGVGLSFAKRFVILSMAAYVLVCIPAAFPRKKHTDSQEV